MVVLKTPVHLGWGRGVGGGEERRGGEGRDGKIITTIVLDYLQCQIG